VYHELKVISEQNLLKRGGVIFIHDTDWPWGRRDMYYQPEMIPSEHRQSWEQKGIVRGQGGLSEAGGYFSGIQKAAHEGGAHNGVLTAIEDFVHEHGAEYNFFSVSGKSGLGIMHRRKSFTDDLTFLTVEGKGLAYNIFVWTGRFTKAYFSSTFSTARSFLKRA
jgi:hypothetical protein